MRYVWFILACLWHLSVGVASAQSLMMPGPGLPVISASYVGPCDVSGVICTAYFSADACAQAAYSGNVIDVVDAATGNTTGTRLQCSNGVVSALVSASACTFVTGNACSPIATTCASSCTFSTVYNQMGTGTVPNATFPTILADRATLALSTLNGKACFYSGASGGLFLSTPNTSTFTEAQPVTIAVIAERAGNFTSTSRLVADNGGTNINLGWSTSANTVRITGSVSTKTASDSAFHSIIGVYNGASSIAVVDGSAGTSGTTSTSFSSAEMIMMNDSPTGPSTSMIGYMCEAMLITGALNSTQYGNISTNARLSNRWGNSF